MANQQPSLSSIQKRVWEGRLPLEIRLAPSECRTYDQAEPYLVMIPCCFPFLCFVASILRIGQILIIYIAADLLSAALLSPFLATQTSRILLFLTH